MFFLLLLLHNGSILVSQVWHWLCPKETYIVPNGFILVPKALVPKVLYIVPWVLYIYMYMYIYIYIGTAKRYFYMYAHLDSFIRRKDQSFCPPWEMKNSGCIETYEPVFEWMKRNSLCTIYIYSFISLSLSMYIYIYVYVHTHIYIYIYIHIYISGGAVACLFITCVQGPTSTCC